MQAELHMLHSLTQASTKMLAYIQVFFVGYENSEVKDKLNSSLSSSKLYINNYSNPLPLRCLKLNINAYIRLESLRMPINDLSVGP